MTLRTRGVRQILRQRRQRPQQDCKNNNFKRNDNRYYYCGEPGHIKQNFPTRRKRNNRRIEDQKILGELKQGEITDDDYDKVENLYFMELGKQVR